MEQVSTLLPDPIGCMSTMLPGYECMSSNNGTSVDYASRSGSMHVEPCWYRCTGVDLASQI
jgi:hypothetical protein